MADSLIFPIGFDLEKGVKDAQGQIDVVLRRLQKTVDGKSLSIRADIDTSKFSVFEAALRGSIQHITDDATRLKTALDTALKTDNSANINRITEAMRNLEAVWKSLPNNQKFDADGKLTAKAQNLIRQFNELATASNTYGQTLTQIAGKIRRAAEEEAKATQKRNDGYAKLRKTLGAQENSIANLTAKIKAYQQILNSKEIGSKSFERVAEKIRKLTEKLDAARAKVKALTQTTVDNSKRQVDAHKNVTTALGEQNSYLGKLIKRMVVYSSFSQFRSFMSNIKEVTAQFELQHVSLGAIIQDQNKANQLFSEIKTFALKSPISIMDLTKYTKQVAAYRIENDKLFDTTKRLADVSVGLGVDMGRLVLAFGQVKAASFLRSAEIRQFTEAGIPMLELLAEKFSELQGRAVSTEQVMKMVENRMVDFRMVEQIFTDLTSAGGMFYNMQEKQGNTLFGLWAKLGDAASVMYDEIGNTDEATYVMKGGIQLLTDLMHNWRFVGREALVVGATLMVLHTRMKLVSSNTKMAETATNSYTLAQRRLNAAQAGSMTAKAAEAAKRAAVANRAAAMSTNAWTAAKFRLVAVVNQLKAALLGNWVTLAIAAFAAICMAIYSAYEKAHRLDNELNKIRSEGSVIQDQSVENFNRLAKAAVESANGSKQQRDALEELNRTYKDILPTDALKLENLRKLKGNYESLTQSVREYIAMQQKEKAINTIQEEYGGDIEKIRKTLHSRFTDKLGPWKMSEEQFSAFWAEFVKQSGDATKTFEQRLHAAFETTGKDAEEMMDKVALYTPTSNPFGENYLEKANRLLDEQRVKIEAESKAWDKAAGGLGKFYDKLEQAKKELSETRFISRGKNGEEVGVDKDTFLYQQMQANAAMKKAAQLIREDDTLKQAIQDKQVQLQPEWIHLVDSVNPNDLMNITYVNFDAIIKAVGDKYPDLTKRLEAIKKEWGNVVPNDGIVRLCQDRLSQIANGVKGGMDVMRQYLWNGSGTVDDYLKTLNNQITAMEAELFSAEQAVAKYGVVGAVINFLNGRSIGDVKEQLDGLRKMAEFVQTLVKPTETTSSDNRLQILNEMVQLAEKLNKEYSDWEKKVGSTHALEKVNNTYKETVKYAEQVAKDAGIKLPHLKTPTNAKELNQYLDAVRKVMETAKGLKGGKKAAIELAVEISDNVSAEDQKAIEAKIKELADRISRTKTAKEFYEKILSQTGDEKLALRVTTHIYGESGQDLKEQVVNQIETALSETKVDLPAGIIDVDKNIDYKALREFANKAKETRAIGDGVADELIKIANNGEKELSRVAQEGAKLLLKYDEIAQQRVNIEQEASNQIKTLREAEALYLASNASEAEKAAYSKRTNKAVAGVEADRDLKLLKLQDEYLRFFSAIHSLTNKEAEALRTKVREALFNAVQSGAISADELKRELKAVDEQFQKLIDDSGFAMDYLKGGFDGLIQRLRDTADEVQSVATKISKMEKPEDITEGQKSFIDKILGKFGDKTTGNNFAELSSKTNDNLKQMGGLLGKVSGKIGGMANGAASALAIVDTIIKGVASTINGIAQIRDQINAMRSEDNQLGGGLWDSFEYLENFNKYAASGWEKLKSGDVAGAVTDTVSSIVSIFGTSQAQKVERLNKRIKEQQEILEELEYSYGRLEKAADRLFGSDYIQNYNQRMRSLEAQQQAYLKQAQLERDKGKSADKEKIKQCENSARDVADQIAEMQSQIAERMTGTDVASAARDFANAWLEAYATFGNTTGAIKEKFNDMIKNMIVESVMAKVVQNALQPMFDEMNEMYKEGASMTEVLSFAFRESAQLSKDIDNGLTVAARQLEAAGIDIKSLYASSDNITGISRDFATASESSINGLAAMYNTEIHHTSYLPVISANVEIMRQLMEARIPSASTTDYGVNWTDWQNQAMDHYRAIRQYTYETAQRCERAAAACEAISEKLGRAFTTKGSSQGFNVYLKQ